MNVLNGLLGFLLLVIVDPQVTGTAPGKAEDDAVLIAEKRAHLDAVLAELPGRDTSHLTPEQLAARQVSLEKLREYRDEGRFPLNLDFPGRRMPYFIDAAGTRCAMAYVLEAAGGGALLQRLASEANHAYVAEIPDDAELLAWIDRMGLTLDEVAFIQGPSRSRPLIRPTDVPNTPEATWGGPMPGPSVIPSTPSAPIGARTPVSAPASPADRSAGSGGNTRRSRAAAAGASWELWWQLHRDQLVESRRTYHEQQPVTPSRDGQQALAWSPTPESLRDELIPALKRLATMNEDLAIDGLVALASIEQNSDDPWLHSALEQFVSLPSREHREYAILAWGVAKQASARPPLRAILENSSPGRELLREREQVPARLRAFAALSLGRCGSEEDVTPLMNVLFDPQSSTDLQSACIVGLGLLSERTSNQREIVRQLARALEHDRLPTVVRAHVPAALARSNDPAALALLTDWVAKFRGPHEIRRACALALAEAAPSLDATLLEILVAQSRRDPDPAARQFAILTIGRLLDRQPLESASESGPLVRQLARFYGDGLSGFFRQPADIPWIALSAALFGRRHPDHRGPIRERLVHLAREAPEDVRSAAALSLGILGDEKAHEVLRGLLDQKTAPKLMGYAAEALGLAGDRSVSERLLQLCLEGTSDRIRYQSALGLGALADPRLVPNLLRALATTSSEPVRAAVSHVLGQTGDRRALPFLISWALDASKDTETRRRSIGALGRLAEPAEQSWTVELRRGYDFTSASDTMQTVLDLF